MTLISSVISAEERGINGPYAARTSEQMTIAGKKGTMQELV